jgi:hypothetical protein
MTNAIDDAYELPTLFGLALLAVVPMLVWFHTDKGRRRRRPWLARKNEPSLAVDTSQLTLEEIAAETARLRALNALNAELEIATRRAGTRRRVLHRAPRDRASVRVRMAFDASGDLVDLLDELALQEGTTRADIVRRGISVVIVFRQQKALGRHHIGFTSNPRVLDAELLGVLDQ